MSKKIEELLPFYVNGSLSERERAEIEAALAENNDLRKEYEYLKALRAEVKAQGEESDNSPGELGLKRLQKSVAAEKRNNDPIARAESKIPREQSGWWRAVAIAACLMLMIQSGFVWFNRSADLTAAQGPMDLMADERVVAVTFTPGATEQDIRDLLLEADARIVAGPSAIGVYLLAVPAPEEASVDQDGPIESPFESRPDVIDSMDTGGSL